MNAGYVRVVTTSPRGDRSRRLFVVAAVLWLTAAALAVVRLVAVIAFTLLTTWAKGR